MGIGMDMITVMMTSLRGDSCRRDAAFARGEQRRIRS